ncbi:hypothetical protein B1992_15415, partial [Pseudoxanthomonas broegbernensis]
MAQRLGGVNVVNDAKGILKSLSTQLAQQVPRVSIDLGQISETLLSFRLLVPVAGKQALKRIRHANFLFCPVRCSQLYLLRRFVKSTRLGKLACQPDTYFGNFLLLAGKMHCLN